MDFQRSSGVLLHISSLPSYGGIGDLGPAAHDFVAFLAAAKQHVWQVLPLCPTGYGNSPYAGSSAFAGNPYLISLEYLCGLGMDQRRANRRALRGAAAMWILAKWRSGSYRCFTRRHRTFWIAARTKKDLRRSGSSFRSSVVWRRAWLADYAMYAELRRQFNTGAWTVWPEAARRRDPKTLAQVASQSGRCPRARARAAICVFAAVESAARDCGTQWNSDSWRRGDLRQYGLGGCLGASGHLRT